MSDWTPITRDEFLVLFQRQLEDLTPDARRLFERYRVPLWRAKIRRSADAGDEEVFVVAQSGTGVLYFDDVEYGFNPSEVDADGRILQQGGSQSTLGEAIEQWFQG